MLTAILQNILFIIQHISLTQIYQVYYITEIIEDNPILGIHTKW